MKRARSAPRRTAIPARICWSARCSSTSDLNSFLPGFRVQPPKEPEVPGFRMNPDGSIDNSVSSRASPQTRTPQNYNPLAIAWRMLPPEARASYASIPSAIAEGINELSTGAAIRDAVNAYTDHEPRRMVRTRLGRGAERSPDADGGRRRRPDEPGHHSNRQEDHRSPDSRGDSGPRHRPPGEPDRSTAGRPGGLHEPKVRPHSAIRTASMSSTRQQGSTPCRRSRQQVPFGRRRRRQWRSTRASPWAQRCRWSATGGALAIDPAS